MDMSERSSDGRDGGSGRRTQDAWRQRWMTRAAMAGCTAIGAAAGWAWSAYPLPQEPDFWARMEAAQGWAGVLVLGALAAFTASVALDKARPSGLAATVSTALLVAALVCAPAGVAMNMTAWYRQGLAEKAITPEDTALTACVIDRMDTLKSEPTPEQLAVLVDQCLTRQEREGAGQSRTP